MIKNLNNFLTKIKDLKLYIVQFEENNQMKLKIYPSYYIVGRSDWQSIIIITLDKYTFFANNDIKKA